MTTSGTMMVTSLASEALMISSSTRLTLLVVVACSLSGCMSTGSAILYGVLFHSAIGIPLAIIFAVLWIISKLPDGKNGDQNK